MIPELPQPFGEEMLMLREGPLVTSALKIRFLGTTVQSTCPRNAGVLTSIVPLFLNVVELFKLSSISGSASSSYVHAGYDILPWTIMLATSPALRSSVLSGAPVVLNQLMARTLSIVDTKGTGCTVKRLLEMMVNVGARRIDIEAARRAYFP